MRLVLLLLYLIVLISFTSAILEFENCPSVANSNFTLIIFSNLPVQVAVEGENSPVLVNQVIAGGVNGKSEWSINFSNAPRNLYSIAATAGEATAKCSFAYASPELTTTKIPDSNFLIVVLSVLAFAFVMFRKSKKR